MSRATSGGSEKPECMQGAPDETSSLLAKADEPSEEDVDFATTSVETFSDLVVAAAISSLSSQLAGETPSITDWLWFLLRVFFIVELWHNCLILNHVVDLFGSKETAENRIYLHVFGVIFLLVCLVRTSMNEHNAATALIYVFTRFLALFLSRVECTGPRRLSVSEARYRNFTASFNILVFTVTLECLPLVIAVCFFRTAPDGVLIGGYVSGLIFLTWHRVLGRQYDAMAFENTEGERVVDLNHIRDRYEVIMLVFLGELCFLDASSEEAGYYVSVCSLVTAVGAFLIYSDARVRGRRDPLFVSAEASAQYRNLHIILFCVITSMGVAFNQIIRDRATGSKVEWNVDPQVLLCSFGGLFLVLSGLMDLLAKDPTNESEKPRLSQRYRVSLYVLSGLFLVFYGKLSTWRHPETVVPAVFMAVAIIQMWGTRHRQADRQAQSEGRLH